MHSLIEVYGTAAKIEGEMHELHGYTQTTAHQCERSLKRSVLSCRWCEPAINIQCYLLITGIYITLPIYTLLYIQSDHHTASDADDGERQN